MKKILLVSAFAMLLASPAFCASDEENKKILKDALVGAVTGAVATEGTKEEPKPAAVAEEKKSANFKPRHRYHHDHDDDDDDDDDKEEHEHHKHHEKKRPHGWDMGKKKGWGDKDVPPGLAKKDE